MVKISPDKSTGMVLLTIGAAMTSFFSGYWLYYSLRDPPNHEAIQIPGGKGLTRQYTIEKLFWGCAGCAHHGWKQ